jgi:hypothetical protein
VELSHLLPLLYLDILKAQLEAKVRSDSAHSSSFRPPDIQSFSVSSGTSSHHSERNAVLSHHHSVATTFPFCFTAPGEDSLVTSGSTCSPVAPSPLMSALR